MVISRSFHNRNGRYSACGQAAVSAVKFAFLPVFRTPVLKFVLVSHIHHPLHGFEASHLDSKVLEKVKSCSFTYFMVSSQPVRTAKGDTYNGYYSHFSHNAGASAATGSIFPAAFPASAPCAMPRLKAFPNWKPNTRTLPLH